MAEFIETKPYSFEEVVSQPVWADATVEEYNSIMKNNVWELVSRLKNKLVVGSKWIYKVKHAVDGSIKEYKMGWNINQMDVKFSFLNGVVEEEFYIEKLEGFETYDRETHVCRLKRAFYGLKHASQAWYTWIDTYLSGLGFTKIEVDVNLNHIVVDGKLLSLVLYVDDLILTRDEQ
eukprot:PITA_33487